MADSQYRNDLLGGKCIIEFQARNCVSDGTCIMALLININPHFFAICGRNAGFQWRGAKRHLMSALFLKDVGA